MFAAPPPESARRRGDARCICEQPICCKPCVTVTAVTLRPGLVDDYQRYWHFCRFILGAVSVGLKPALFDRIHPAPEIV